MSFPSHIFKSYDIRGLVEGDLSPELAYKIGYGFAVILQKKGYKLEGKRVVVGRDMRVTSLEFQKEVMRAITDFGLDVVDIGLVTTPVFNFACAHYLDHAGGIMVTASHNPPEYNGFKMTFEDGLPLGGNTGMTDLRNFAESVECVVQENKGNIVEKQVFTDYIESVFRFVPRDSVKPMKIVVDGGNGMAGVIFPKLIEQLPLEVEYLYIEPYGTFPNHEANPLKTETLQDLQKKVVESGADFGFALDGDADRIGLVDERGEVVEASYVGLLIGLEVLKKHGTGNMLYDLRSSMIIPETWKKEGATKVEKCPVGHANIKKLMKEEKCIFASELSLHLYYGDMYNLECPELSFMNILKILSEQNKPLSQIIDPYRKYFHSGEFNFEVEDKEGVFKKIEEKYKDEALELSHLDGVWMKFGWGWFNVRASNTEPVMRLNLEAKSREVMEEKLGEVRGLIIN